MRFAACGGPQVMVKTEEVLCIWLLRPDVADGCGLRAMQVTGAGLQKLAALPALRRLDLRSCYQVSGNDVRAFRVRGPDLSLAQWLLSAAGVCRTLSCRFSL